MSTFDVFGCPLHGTRLIEASAGTGKTWNLCALYLRLLLERGLQVQHILVVTFTNAATAELRERIRSRIAETLAWLRGTGPRTGDAFVGDLLDHLRRTHGLRDDAMVLRLDLALQSFDEAAILTIHGFCQRALAETPFSAGMPMAQTLLADDGEMRLDIVHDFWRRRIAGEAVSSALAGHLLDARDSPQSLAALLQRRLGKPLSRLCWPEALDQPTDMPDEVALGTAFAAARRLWLREREHIAGIVGAALPRLNKTTYSREALDQAMRSWDALLAHDEVPGASAGMAKLDLLGAARLQPNKGKAPVPAHPFFDCAQTLLALRAGRERALELQRLRLLRDLLEQAPRELRRAKREQRVIAFDDMLYDLHARLWADGGAVLATTLRTRFAAALIDEFQDTDPLQFSIFQSIYAEGDAPLFLVGDPKQAIYSFRHADLHTYLRARGWAQAEYALAENQRSTPELLAAQNALFGANARAFMLQGLDYRPVAYGAKPRQVLHDRSAPPRAALQLWQLPRGRDGEPLPKKEAMRSALEACAGEIARLLGAARRGEITLGDRPLSAGDIAVLVRSHAQGTAMRRALAHLGVGSIELSQASVFDSADADELERLLAAILEPQNVPLLRSALATELMGLDAAALRAVSADEAALLEHITRFSAYRDTWLRRGVGQMLRQWMRAEGVSRRLLSRSDGERRMTNLMHLGECLHEASVGHASPEALLRWLQAQRSESRTDDAVQLRLESDRDLVQVVTIHKSKGLEYPLVFCPMLWDGHTGAARGGAGLEYHDAQGDAVIDFRALDKDELAAVSAQIALEGAAEAMRLIYVALTRAVYRCHLVVGAYRRKHGKTLSATESCRARLNWLVAGAGLSPSEWLRNSLAPQDIEAGWAALAQRHAPQVALDPLPPGPGLPLPPRRAAPETLAALPPPRSIPAAWWIGSYSSLAHGARNDDAAVDHDLRVPVAAPTAAAETPPEAQRAPADADDILRFPRGVAAGECLHAVFEHIDFEQPCGWPAAVDAALLRFAPSLPAADPPLQRPAMLLRMLHDVLHTLLPGGFRLADVAALRKQVEMEFYLPSRHLEALALTALLRRQGYAVPALDFGTLAGYLRGFIDLVFEHEGRFHIVDWKSNHLGDTPDDYAAAALARAMAEQGYHLQALLYALALHRHLQQRVPDYRYEQHFGSVMYLFVRGMRPAWTAPDGSAAGVHAHRPTLHTLQLLSTLLDGSEDRS